MAMSMPAFWLALLLILLLCIRLPLFPVSGYGTTLPPTGSGILSCWRWSSRFATSALSTIRSLRSSILAVTNRRFRRYCPGQRACARAPSCAATSRATR